MHSVPTRAFCLGSLALFLSACASGPSYTEARSNFPPAESGLGRIYIYRTYNYIGSAGSARIALNGELVGQCDTGGFFYVDRPPGNYHLEELANLFGSAFPCGRQNFAVSAGQEVYIKVTLASGMNNPVYVVSQEQAANEMAGLAYGGPYTPADIVSQSTYAQKATADFELFKRGSGSDFQKTATLAEAQPEYARGKSKKAAARESAKLAKMRLAGRIPEGDAGAQAGTIGGTLPADSPSDAAPMQPTGFYAATRFDFDVLDGATVDPSNGSITLFGHRAVGGAPRQVPYLDYLAAAVESSNPTFSLEWTPDSRRSIDNAFNMADQNLTDRLAGGQFDSNGRLTKRGEWWYQMFGVNAYAGMDKMSLWMAMMPVAGYPNAGKVMRAVDIFERTVGTPAEKEKVKYDDMTVAEYPIAYLMSETTGLAVPMSDRDNLRVFAQFFNGADESDEVFNQAHQTISGWILQGIAIAYNFDRDRYAGPYEARIRNGGDFGQAFAEELNRSQDDTPAVQRNAFHALMSSRAFIHIPPDVMREVLGVNPVVVPVYEGLSPSSILGKVAFDADVFGKNLMDMPEVKSDVPNYRTYFEWRQTVASAPATEGHTWFGPDGFELVESADGATIRFGRTPMRVHMERYEGGPGASGRASVEDPELRQYADELTALYDPLAAKYPVLLDLRETMKVMALADWLKQKGIKLSFPAEGRGSWNPPSQYPGVVHMEIAVKQAAVGEVMSASGGVDYRVDRNWQLIKQRLDEQPGPPPASASSIPYDPVTGTVGQVRSPQIDQHGTQLATTTGPEVPGTNSTDLTMARAAGANGSPAAAQQPLSPADEASRLWKANDLPGAELAYRRLIDAAAGDVRQAAGYRALLAEILHEEGNDAAAVRQLNEAAREAPDLPIFKVLYAESLAEGGDIAGAKKALVEALAIDSDNQAAVRMLAKLQAQPPGAAGATAASPQTGPTLATAAPAHTGFSQALADAGASNIDKEAPKAAPSPGNPQPQASGPSGTAAAPPQTASTQAAVPSSPTAALPVSAGAPNPAGSKQVPAATSGPANPQPQASGAAIVSVISPQEGPTGVPVTRFIPGPSGGPVTDSYDTEKANSGLTDQTLGGIGTISPPPPATFSVVDIPREIENLQKKLNENLAMQQSMDAEAAHVQQQIAAAPDELTKSELQAKAADLKVKRLQTAQQAVQLNDEIVKRKRYIDTGMDGGAPGGQTSPGSGAPDGQPLAPTPVHE